MEGDIALQVAFETIPKGGLRRAVRAVLSAGASHVEVGTPLIKEHGMATAREVRPVVPPGRLYVDTKTIDFPELELTAARAAGADCASVLAVAPDEALKRATAISKETGLELMVSTMGYPLPLLRGRVETIRDLGITSVIAHGAGQDLDGALRRCLETARVLRPIPGIRLVLGGGIAVASLTRVLEMNPVMLIVGRAITAHPNLELRTTELAEGLEKLRRNTQG